jgi:hypothetical protein
VNRMKSSIRRAAVALLAAVLAAPAVAADWAADEADIRRPIAKAFREKYFRDARPIQQLRYEQLAVRPLGPDAALATARWILSGGDKPDLSGWFTLAWERTPAGWRAVHDHSS